MKKERKFNFITDLYVWRPYTRKTNKIVLKHKVVFNPWLKGLVINMDESPQDQKKKDQPKKKQKVKVSKEEGLILLSTVMDSLS